jgi:putative FmdB family regulatory protein
MPIYEYRCKKCGEFEVTQRMSDAPLTRCPTCRAKVTKLMSSTSFQLKGSGWYVTDYARKDSKGGESSKDTKAETKTESKAETSDSKSGKTDSKSEKSDSKSDTKAGKTAEAAAA